MNAIPAHIPRSLKSYLEQYQRDPEKTIDKLETHLKKRGADAVGFYLLSWFYHYNGNTEQAVESAWKAKIFAPGSPTMEQLHYFMSHPKKFKAWKPFRPTVNSQLDKLSGYKNLPISDLDSLIERLSSVESKRIRLDVTAPEGPDLSEESAKVEDIATETLAVIHEKQGNKSAAIHTYQKLMNRHPDKEKHYKEQIHRLMKEKEGKKKE